jgi:hypothetical protein
MNTMKKEKVPIFVTRAKMARILLIAQYASHRLELLRIADDDKCISPFENSGGGRIEMKCISVLYRHQEHPRLREYNTTAGWLPDKVESSSPECADVSEGLLFA